MHSINKVDSNIANIGKLFPNCLTERKNEKGELEYAIDFDMLRQELSNEIVEGNEERYQFTWPDKKQSILLANAPIAKTLRPCVEESVDFDSTENLYIEGDNLDVLKLLQETYMGKVKMIYIDPPYNTGNDFVYEDDFAQNTSEYLANSGQYDEEGNRLVQNNDTNGRFHTDWLNMIYPRLKVAKDLLTDDGVIFISIDDNEVDNLKKVCNEVFGESNFVANFIWRGGRRNASKFISTSHEYILCYTKQLIFCSDNNISWHETKKGLTEIYSIAENLLKDNSNDYVKASTKLKKWYSSLPDDNESKSHSHYCWIDDKGVYFASDISRGGGGGPKWEIVNPNTGNIVSTPSRGWAYSKKEDLEKDIQNNKIHFNGDGVPCKKRYLKENETQLLETVFYKDRRGSSKRLRSLMQGDFFGFPKDENIIKNLLSSFINIDDIILDFFSGSATTAHAVMQLNAEDGGNRKFIMVQLPEETDEKSEANKAGYKNICEIGKERIRRAGKKIKEESKNKEGIEKLDTGFRVLKLDSTNMKDVYYSPTDYSQDLFDSLTDNIKPDRTPQDLLFQVMLDLGVLLSSRIEENIIEGKKVFNVNDNYLIACFDNAITDATIKAIAQKKPYYFAMRDSSVENDSVITNFEQLFATYSPDTVRKVL